MREIVTGSVGSQLRRARMSQGLSIEDAAVATKVPKKSIEALENDALTILPAPVFIRGFVRAYGTYLGLDADELIRQLPLEVRQVIPPSGWVPPQTDDYAPSTRFRPSTKTAGLRSTHALLLLLAVGMLIAAWVMVGQQPVAATMNVNEQPPAIQERVEGVSSFFGADSVR